MRFSERIFILVTLLPIFINSWHYKVGDPEKRWPDGIVPYWFASNLPTHYVPLIEEAMGIIEDCTCVRFVLRKKFPFRKSRDFLMIQKADTGDICQTELGRIGGMQTMQVGDLCLDSYKIVHERTLGFSQEQGRDYGDEYIKSLRENVEDGLWHDFEKKYRGEYDTIGLPFYPCSVMQYKEDSFGREIAGQQPPTMQWQARDIVHCGQQIRGFAENYACPINMAYKCVEY